MEESSRIGKVKCPITGCAYCLQPMLSAQNVIYFHVICVNAQGEEVLIIVVPNVWDAIRLGETFLEAEERKYKLENPYVILKSNS